MARIELTPEVLEDFDRVLDAAVERKRNVAALRDTRGDGDARSALREHLGRHDRGSGEG